MWQSVAAATGNSWGPLSPGPGGGHGPPSRGWGGGGQGRPADLLCVAPPFQERYTCPSLALHPREPVFLAQTNGNYLALFSAVWPYRMSRRRRYEGHKVPCPRPVAESGGLITGPGASCPTASAADSGPRVHRPSVQQVLLSAPR